MKYILILATALCLTSCGSTTKTVETQPYILTAPRYRYTVIVTFNNNPRVIERITYEGYDDEFPYLKIINDKAVAIGDSILAVDVQSIRLIEQTLINK